MQPPNPCSSLLEVDARRICVIKPSALGDVVQSLTLLPALRARFPRAHIAWVINRSLAPLLEGHPHLDEIIPFERQGNWADWWRLLARLNRSAFDLVFDLQGLLRSGTMMLATQAPLRVGLESAREGSMWGCHLLVPNTGLSVPAHSRSRQVAAALGLPDVAMPLHVSVPSADGDWAASELARLPGSVLAIHAGAGWRTKRWPPERFAAVACKALRRFGMSPVLLGTPDEASLVSQVEQTIRRFAPSAGLLNLAGRTTIKQLAAVLQRSSALLTNDSGPMQLAAGLGTPVVGIFTCTDPGRSGPPGPQHELVSTGVSCAASYRKRCPYRGRRHMACMEELDVDRVWRALCRLMEKNGVQTAAA